MNLWDMLILTAVAAAAILALRRIHRQRRNGAGTCSGNCAACRGCGGRG